MGSFKYINRLEYIFHIFKNERTGCAAEFADKLGMSRRQLFNCMDELKSIGVPIKYNRQIHSFYLEKESEFKVEVSFTIK